MTENGAYKINDVIVEGISMMVTQRSEFASVVQRNGGQVRGLSDDDAREDGERARNRRAAPRAPAARRRRGSPACSTWTRSRFAACCAGIELIPAMEKALAAFSLGQVVQPVRNMLTIEEGKRYLGVMPAVADGRHGGKARQLLSRAMRERACATHHAMILLFRPDTGEPLAVMDGRLITEMRTAAVSAAVTKILAAPDSRVLALLGSGVQARCPSARRCRGCGVSRKSGYGAAPPRMPSALPSSTAPRRWPLEAAVRGADVIVTATNALRADPRGGLAEAGGACECRRLAAARIGGSSTIGRWPISSSSTSREAVLKESGDVILSGATIYAEAGEIFAGAKAGSGIGDDRLQIGRARDRRHCGGETGLRRRCEASLPRSLSVQSYGLRYSGDAGQRRRELGPGIMLEVLDYGGFGAAEIGLVPDVN